MDKNSGQKTVVVLGMTSSGTSLIASMLQSLGVNMGNEIIPADSTHLSGYFEDKNFFDLNKKILKYLESDIYDLRHPPPQEAVRQLVDNKKFYNEIKKLIDKSKGVWGWKNPQTSLLLELYYPHLTNPYLVVGFRNYYDIAQSLIEIHHGFDNILSGLKLTNLYYQRILEFIDFYRPPKVIYLSFESVLRNPVAEARKLAKLVGLNFSQKDTQIIQKLITPTNKIEQERIRVRKLFDQRIVSSERKIIVLSEQLEKIESSLSWKITKPLRKIKKILKKIKERMRLS